MRRGARRSTGGLTARRATGAANRRLARGMIKCHAPVEHHRGLLADKPNLTLAINRSDLKPTMMGAKTLEAQIGDGTAKIQGDADVLN
jgi:alkyl sulfatase BDS1-like metallo-beta-lactamase superfamily hydrolase